MRLKEKFHVKVKSIMAKWLKGNLIFAECIREGSEKIFHNA